MEHDVETLDSKIYFGSFARHRTRRLAQKEERKEHKASFNGNLIVPNIL